MNQTDENFSTQQISPKLVSQIIEAIRDKAYGSVEIYIENYNVVQITERTITKVGHNANGQRKFVRVRARVQLSSPKDKLTV